MKRKIKEKRGITLVSLVVTIIVLLILSAVSVAMLTGENGIFKTAQKAKIESQKADYRETIELSKVEEGINKKLNRTKKEKLEGIYNILRNGEKFKKDVDNSKASMELIDNDELEPRIVIKTKEGWKYTVTVDGIIEGEIPPIDLEKADIKIEIEPTGWTNEDVEVVSIKVQNEEYKENKIQYSYDLKAWRDYKDIEKIKITENKKIYARLANGLSISDKYSTGNVINIDKKEAEISTAMNSSNVTTKGFTVNVGVKDENSGLGKIVWYYKKSDATSYTSEEVIYKDLHSVQAGETTAVTKSKTYDNLTSGTYNVYAEIYDVAGNITNANSSDKPLEIKLGTVTGLTTANTTFKANPDTWTNGKVTMTASTNVSGYTIQTSKDAQKWSSTASQEFTENGKIYARLWDGTNAGGYSTGNVTNIDTLAPKDFTPTATSTTKSITVTANTTDAEATNTSASSGIAGYRFKLDSGSWTEYQASGTYKWDNLTQTTNHTITVEAKDNAENTKQGTVTKGTGTVAGLTDANTTFTASPTGWTNGKVTMTASTNVSGYTIQTSKDAQTWSSTASQEFTENGKIYARLWDGTNAGGYSTGNVTNIDTLAPKGFTPIATSTTKSITVNASTTDADVTSTSASSGIAGYRFKLDSGSWTEYQASGTYKWDNLAQTTNHTITVEAKDNAGNTKQGTATKGTGTVEGLTTANTTFKANPTGWTNGKVTMTASTNVSGYTIQTTKTPTVESSWKNTASQEFTENGKIYARLWDGTNAGGYSTGNVTNIDTLAPKGFKPTATSTTKSITVTANTTDAEATNTSASSGIAGYRFKLDSGSWTEYQASGTYKWDNLAQTTNHTITVEAKDNAGNTKQGTATKGTGTVAGLTTANTTFTASPTGWTNGKVTMTASTNVSGYTIQTTKTPTVESSWKNTASQEFTENGKIYARLWDGTNAGGYSTGNVTNIDTLAPKGFTPTATSTTKSITVTANTTDAEATNTSASSGIAGYRFKLDSGSWTEYQASGTYKWDNLAQTTNHTITVEVKDNAGNTKQGTVNKGTGTVAGLTTANTTFTANPTGWTNGKVTMTASTNVSGYTIQTSKDAQTWSSTASREFTENGKIYARLWDGTNAGGYSTGNVTNIDTLAPKDFTPTATSTTKSITVTAKTTDADATETSASSGIAGYRFKLDSGSWTEYQASGTYKWDNLAQTTNHTITVEAKDNAGNTKQGTATKGTGTVAGLTTANTTFTANPTGWTNGKVTMTASTNVSGYTIQTTKTPTVESSWKSTASQEFTENGKIYARLWDGTNAGGYSTGNVTNIDTLAPKDFNITTTSSTGTITVTANTTDADATSTSGSSGIAGYRFKLNNENWTNYQTSGTYSFSNLIGSVSGEKYNIYVETKDNSGNVTLSTKEAYTIKDNDYYVDKANTLIGEVDYNYSVNRKYYKTNDEPAIVVWSTIGNFGEEYDYFGPLLVSTSPDAVKYYTSDHLESFSYESSFEYNGVTFYVSAHAYFFETDRSVYKSDYLSIGNVYDLYKWPDIGKKLATRYFTGSTDKNYTVYYNANGGTGIPNMQNKRKDSSITLSSTIPTRSGYHFLGWSTNKTSTTAEYSAGGNYNLNKSEILYAVWQKHDNENDIKGTCSICGGGDKLMGTEQLNAQWNFTAKHDYVTKMFNEDGKCRMWVSFVANWNGSTGDYSQGGNIGMLILKNKVDLTNVDKIIMNCTIADNHPSGINYTTLGISNSNSSSSSSDYETFNKSVTVSQHGSSPVTYADYKCTLDVSDISGEYYLKVTTKHDLKVDLAYTADTYIESIFLVYK